MNQRSTRNIGLLGAEGQRAIERTAVGLVGYGGLGSHFGLQLAYLGTQKLVVVDGKTVSETNLNRLVGAIPADVESGVRKIDIAERVITAVNPEATVLPLYGTTDDGPIRAALEAVDVVIGAVDNDVGRLALLELCSTRGIPYLDAATDAGQFEHGPVWFGGRVYLGVGHGCMSCFDLLDQRALARAGMTVEQREADDRIYGVDRALLDGTGPMVVSVNGVVASIGVTELIALVTGLRPPKRHLVYDGQRGVVNENVDTPRESCFYCEQWRRERGDE